MPVAPERILITGYSGFVAPYLAATCQRQYPAAQFFGLVHAATPPTTHAGPPAVDASPAYGSLGYPSVRELAGDITDGVGLRSILRETRPDLIFHLAAASSVAASWNDPAEVLRVNAGGFITLAEAVRAEQLSPRIVVSGSGEQYGLVRPEENPVTEETLPRPANPYAVSKETQDLYAFQYQRAYGLDIVRARAFNHFGPGQSASFVIASFARQIAQVEAGLAEPTLLVGNLSAQRDFLPVEAVVAAYLALAERGHAGEAYNIGSGVARSIESLLHQLLAMARVTIEARVDPTRFRAVDVPVLCAETTKIQRDTDWRPTAMLDDALRATLDYWRNVVVP
jgi:GDP-4-dehydro-6-deoxy-D-mannose reductase